MPRHLIDIDTISDDQLDDLFCLADEGPRAGALAGLTYLSAFFQESTRTRLGFAAAAARQGAAVLDMGPADRLRLEPAKDQQLVLAGIADVTAVRHWDARFACDLASRDRTSVVNAGAAGASHPTQALIDVYTLTRAFRRDLSGLHVLFLGPLLRSAECFRKVASKLDVRVTQMEVDADPSPELLRQYEADLRAADVVYVQSLSDTDYTTADLNSARCGPDLPRWIVDAIDSSVGAIMHALPRGPELPDALMWRTRSLVTDQVENGMAMRSAILRWMMRT